MGGSGASRRSSRRLADVDRSRVRIVDAPDVVGMDSAPGAALRRKPARLDRGCRRICRARGSRRPRQRRAHRRDRDGGACSVRHAAGGRPARPRCHDSDRGQPAVLLDVGASVGCRPQHLLQFAVMGSVYARLAVDVARPRIGLLSIGEEETKGNELTREAHRLLKAAPLAFIGNVEARRVYSGDADVIVCDGFTGNVALKISEGLVDKSKGESCRGPSRRASGRCSRVVRCGTSAGASITRSMAAHRCSASRASPWWATGVRTRKLCATPSRWLTASPSTSSSRRSSKTSRRWRSCIDRSHLSRPGFPESRDGQGARRRLSDLPRDVRRSGSMRSASRCPESSSKGQTIGSP